MIYKKGTMLVPSGPRHDNKQKHLHIICNDTCDLGFNLLVSVSSFYDGCDSTCELDSGDHPSVTHLSYVFYAKAKIYKAADLENGFVNEILIPKPDMEDEVFERVEAGICTSLDTPRKIKKYIGC